MTLLGLGGKRFTARQFPAPAKTDNCALSLIQRPPGLLVLVTFTRTNRMFSTLTPIFHGSGPEDHQFADACTTARGRSLILAAGRHHSLATGACERLMRENAGVPPWTARINDHCRRCRFVSADCMARDGRGVQTQTEAAQVLNRVVAWMVQRTSRKLGPGPFTRITALLQCTSRHSHPSCGPVRYAC